MKRYALVFIVFLSVAYLTTPASANEAIATTETCSALPSSSSSDDYYISDCQTVGSGTYTYQYLHVVNGGKLIFNDDGGTINFNAKSILVEQGGSIKAGSYDVPFGTAGGKLIIGLYGAGPGNIATNPNPDYSPIGCQGDTCYDSSRVGKGCLNSGTFNPADPCQAILATDHSQDNSYFEGYAAGQDGDNSIFGYKVFAVSYGGSLELFGSKGVAAQFRTDPSIRTATCPVPAAANQNDITQWAALTGNSWARAGASSAGTTLTLDRAVDWTPGDQLIVGTTDWSASHSELASVSAVDTTKTIATLNTALQYPHNGAAYTVPSALLTSTGNPNGQVENRAAIGLLTRSITIQSLGATATDPFPASANCAATANNPDCYFGAQMMVRQGFAKFQIQGVEFHQMGQGGRMGRYPVHFHMVKDASYTNAFVKDSSIWESNTRFVVVHATHNVEVSRNVGYLSMGHGFYIEDGSEINNLFCQNLGVSARAALTDYFTGQESTSPEYRFIPPILNTMNDQTVQGSDAVYPTMFWIMNAYNEFVGNQSVGVHGFGACYWPLSSSVSGPSASMTWARNSAAAPTYQTYSELDYANFNQAGARQAPFKRFRGNGCATAAYALMTERASLQPDASNFVFTPALNPPATPPTASSPVPVNVASNLYTIATSMLPVVASNFYGIKYAMSPDTNPTCASGYGPGQASTNGQYCVATVIDRFTTSFNWAQTNFGSVWLRPWSYVFSNSAITDQLFGGLGFVSGGSWDQVLNRQLAIAKDSLFVGSIAPTDQYAGQNGPDMSNAICSQNNGTQPMPFCYFQKDGVGLYMGGFNSKRMITIYDGPFFSDGNIFTQVNTSNSGVKTQPGSTPPYATGTSIYDATNQPAYPLTASSVQNPALSQYSVINAAIGWKQPNGFYYPPAFAFRKSGFDSTTERHNVLDQYAYYIQGQLWGTPISNTVDNMGATPIDSTTILNDLDGSLNGMAPSTGGARTSGLSNNAFYDAPFKVAQCNSFGTETIPQDFVTTVITKLQAPVTAGGSATNTDTTWSQSHPAVPVYRQLETGSSGDSCSTNAQVCGVGVTPCCRRSTLFMGAGIGAAPGLTMNQGTYYIDTNAVALNGSVPAPFVNANFTAGASYLIHHLYAAGNSKTTYQVYVGPNYVPGSGQWVRIDPHVQNNGLQVTPAPVSSSYGSSSYDGTSGILTVTLDNGTVASDYAFPTSAVPEDACFPSNLCQIESGNNPQKCTVSDTFPEPDLKESIKSVCNYWSSRTTGQSADGVYLNDCPRGGCIGFSFTLPAGFTAVPYASAGQALASCYPNSAPWKTGLKITDKSCAKPPGKGNFCK
ncbi:MAG: hypothetical protein M0R41_01485 [Methylobacter tundripaludum]|nr:hypothetical protein [Methylobacter tundripaludum]